MISVSSTSRILRWEYKMSSTKKRILFLVIAIAVFAALLCFGTASFANEAPTAEIKYHNLSYRANVSIKYAVEVTDLPEGVGVADAVGVKVKKGDIDYDADYEGQTFIGGAEYSVFGFSELSAAEMTVDVYATPYVKISETEVITGKTHKNSVLDYSYKVLGKIEGGNEFSPKVRNLILNMLSYGAAVQDYTETNVDRPANADYYQIKVVNGTLPDGFSRGLYQDGDTVTLTASQKAGYGFSCWKDFAGSVVGNLPTLTVKVENENTAYTAVFEKAATSIYYELDSGTLPEGNWSIYSPGVAFTLPTPTKSGYVFKGWYSNASFEGDAITSIPSDSVGSLSFYAKWISTEEDLVDKLVEKIELQRTKLSNSYDFISYTANIGSSPWGTIDSSPTDEHPRLMITRNMLPTIRLRLSESDDKTNRRFLQDLKDAVIENDCILPDPKNLGENEVTGNRNEYNYDPQKLEIIQAKALAYLVYEDEYYGYQAILYMKNYLESLKIISMGNDQYYEYGFVMFTAAIVYDWCYDLLTDTDKTQFIAGVENRICRMENDSGKAMPAGLPPSEGNPMTGTSTTTQILRNYLSFAVAIYDENTSWWDYTASRIVHDFVPFRDFYYQSGIVYNGTSYTTNKSVADMSADWIFSIATGDSLYAPGIRTAIKGTLGYECFNGQIFQDGDNHGLDLYRYIYPVTIAAYLYEDATLLAQSKWLAQQRIALSYTYNDYFTSVQYIAIRGLSNVEPNEERHEGMPVIQYNGSPLGQYVLREFWSNEDVAAAVKIRIKEYNNGDHEHGDSGTFEIYYKGMLTNGGGMYSDYGSDHSRKYYAATISKNGLVIFNPNDTADWCSGSQRSIPTAATFNSEVVASRTMATVTGRQHGYKDLNEKQALYSYIAGDITKAYTYEANYVGRRMLTVYTGNADFPMALFVYDDVEASNAEFQKKFLLQISSKDEPTVDSNNGTIITENEGGRLVLTSLSDNVRFDKQGGRVYDSNGNYDAAASSNYLINGVQCVPPIADRIDDGHWGRVEIVSEANSQKATFMNVLYVTDKGQTKAAPDITKVTGSGVEGGIFGNIAAIFATSRDRATTELSATVQGSGSMNYYVSGVAEGTWYVTVNGQNQGNYTATAEGGLLTFTAPAGSVVITPVSIK